MRVETRITISREELLRILQKTDKFPTIAPESAVLLEVETEEGKWQVSGITLIVDVPD